MIEKIEMADLKDPPDGLDEITMLFDKINQLIEASNRQDRAIGFLMINHPQLTRGLYRDNEGKLNDVAEQDFQYWESLRG